MPFDFSQLRVIGGVFVDKAGITHRIVASPDAGIAQLVERNLAKVVGGRPASPVPATTAVDKRS